MSPPRTWIADAGLIALAVLIGGVFLGDSRANEPTGPLPVDLAFGVLGCAALLVRRRWPVALALALIPTILVSASAMGATAVAMSAVACYRSARWTAAVLGAHVAFLVFVLGLAATDPRDFWQGLALLVALDAAFLASGLLVRSQRLLVASLRDRAREAEEGQRLRVEEARHAERERIAREMHDVLAHRLSLLVVHAGALQVHRTASVEERQASAGVVRECAHQALEDLREVIWLLREDSGDRPQPALTDVPALVEQSRLAGAAVTLEYEVTGSPVDGTGRHAYRIVQEALTNARKHAPGAPVTVRVATGEGLEVAVTNPVPPGGSGIPGAGAGLIGLRERVDLAGGRLRHGLTPDGRFEVRAWLPWRA